MSCPVRQDSRQDKTSTSQDKKSCKTSCLVLRSRKTRRDRKTCSVAINYTVVVCKISLIFIPIAFWREEKTSQTDRAPPSTSTCSFRRTDQVLPVLQDRGGKTRPGLVLSLEVLSCKTWGKTDLYQCYIKLIATFFFRELEEVGRHVRLSK